MLFDTHCHLYDEAFNDVEEIINNAKEVNVKLFLIPGDNVVNSLKALKIALNHENIYCAIGVHPEEIYSLDLDESLATLKQTYLTNQDKIKAIGEIGLDYHWDKDEEKLNRQKIWFKKQIELANDLHLPIIVHSRDACLDTLEILKSTKPLYGCVYHCFSYSKEVLNEILNLGFYIGLDGPVTYKNALTPKEVAKIVPLDRLLIETDSPYLPPTPHRGQRNEPSYLTYISQAIALEKGISYDELTNATFNNGCRFFNIKYE